MAIARLPNVLRTDRLRPDGDAVVQGFWWLCPSCADHPGLAALEAWHQAHPAAAVVAITCDSDFQQTNAFVYERGWTFPVRSYAGPLSFGECFEQLQRRDLGIGYYADIAFLSGGAAADHDPGCGYPDYPGRPSDCEPGLAGG